MNFNKFSSYIKTPYTYSSYIISKYSILLIPVPIIKITTGEGLKVFEIEFEDKYKNFSAYIKPNKRAIYVNESMPLVNKRFKIAKQLGHYLMHKYKILSSSKVTNKSTVQENIMTMEANIFATNLLIPTTTLKLKVPQYKSIRSPQQIMAKEFQVSENVMHFKLSMLQDIHKFEKEIKNRRIFKANQTNKEKNKECLLQIDKLKESIATDLEKKETSRKEAMKKIFEDLE